MTIEAISKRVKKIFFNNYGWIYWLIRTINRLQVSLAINWCTVVLVQTDFYNIYSIQLYIEINRRIAELSNNCLIGR